MKKTITRVLLALLLIAILGRFGWVFALSASTRQSASSPDKRYVADVSSRWRSDFWFGAPHDCHDIRIMALDGQIIRRIVMDDRSDGWPQECSIYWTANSSSVSVAFSREEIKTARIIIPLKPWNCRLTMGCSDEPAFALWL